jgi:RNA methyltransferase, TrmH family
LSWGTWTTPQRATSNGGMPGTPAISPKRAARLKAKKYREAERLFLAEGTPLLEEATVPPVQVFDEEAQILRVSTLKTPAGPVGVFRFLDVALPDLLSRVQRVVLLQGVQDPGNVGTAIRSAHAFGAGVALSRGSADLYNPKTVRASMGSIFHAPVAREVEPVEFLDTARSAGFTTVAAMPGVGVMPKNMPEGPLVMCIGAEGFGLPEGVVGACDMRVTIPSMAPSLNASVAASILLYEAYSRVLP